MSSFISSLCTRRYKYNNTKRNQNTNLYYGNMVLVIISKIEEEEGDWLHCMHDSLLLENELRNVIMALHEPVA